MKPEVKALFNERILDEAARRYAVKAENMQALDGFESFIYAFDKEEQSLILRIGHSNRRSPELVHGEVDWLNYLSAGGAGVARAVVSGNDQLVEKLEDGRGGHFLATAFERAPGGSPWASGQWQPPLFERYGRLIGRLHALSKHYRLPDPAWKRLEWDDPIMLFAQNWLPPSDGLILNRYDRLLAHLQALPKSRESYGLIHQDAHGGNFFVDEAGQITLFDFDDCAYSWYANDLAIVLFYAVTNVEDAAAFGKEFWAHFLRGYRQENTLDPAWLGQIPHFLKLREIDLYAVIHRSFDVENLTDSWVAGFMHGRRERILDDVPYLEIEFGI